MTTNHISYIYRRQKTPMGWWRKPRTTSAQNDVVGLSDGSYPQLDPKERPEWWWTLTLAWVADILDQCPVNPAIESRRETRLCTTTTRLCLQRKLLWGSGYLVRLGDSKVWLLSLLSATVFTRAL